MFRKVLAIAVVSFGSISLINSTRAQDGEPPIRRPSLSDRLEQFRQDLRGDTSNSSSNTRSRLTDRKPTKNQPRLATPPSNPPQMSGMPQGNGRDNSPAVPNPNTSGPSKPQPVQGPMLEAQSARRAQPNGARDMNPLQSTTMRPARREVHGGAPLPPPVAPPQAAREVEPPPILPPPTIRPPVTLQSRQDSKSDARGATSQDRAGATDVLFTAKSPVLHLEAVGPRRITIGRESAFTVRVRNVGEITANNVVVKLNIPEFAQLAGVQASAGSTRASTAGPTPEPFEWRMPRLDKGGQETLTLRLVPHKSNPIDFALQWTCSPSTTQTVVEVQEPKLQMAISGPDELLYGDSKVYKLTLSNPGNGDADNVVLTLLPIGRAEGAATQRLGTLKAGETKSIEVELTARQAGEITIRAQALAEGDLHAEVAEAVLVRQADLAVNVEAPKVKYAGTAATYRVHVANVGNAPAAHAKVAAMLPMAAKYLSSDAGGHHEPEGNKVVWNLGELAPGSERTIQVQCNLTTPGESRAQFIAQADRELSSSTVAETHVEALADLKLEVRDPQGPVAVGDDAVYEVHVRNRGTKNADGIDVTIYFSDGLEATSIEGGRHEIGNGQVTLRRIDSVPAGGESVYTVHAKASKSGTLIFRAELVCESLQTKLTAEEATRFYGDEGASEGEEPTPARPLEPTPARPLEPTPAIPPKDQSSDSDAQ